MKKTVMKATGVCLLCAAIVGGSNVSTFAAKSVGIATASAGVSVTLDQFYKSATASEADSNITDKIDSEESDTEEAEQVENTTEETEQAEEVTDETASEDSQEEETTSSVVNGYTNLGVANVDTYLNVRQGPGEDQEVVGKLPQNAGCEVVATEGEWYQITSGKVSGYVKAEYLLTGDEANAKAEEVKDMMATVNTTTLKVRMEPSTDAKVLTLVPIEEELEVLEETDDWVKVTVDSDEGYVSKEFVDLSYQLPKAVTIAELKYGEGVSDVRVDIVQYAKQFLGNPYVWGGTSLTNGADCSGFVLSILSKYGVSLPHSSAAQSQMGSAVSLSDVLPGDLVFYGNGSSVNHVAMYIGNGQVIHASSAKTGIKISNMYYRTPIRARRFIN